MSPTCAKTWVRPSVGCPTRYFAGAWPPTSRGCEHVRMVDLPAVRLPDVFTPDLLAPDRASQPRCLAGAAGRARRRPCLALAGRNPARRCRPRACGPARRNLALGGLGFSLAALRHHQLGGSVLRGGLRHPGRVAGWPGHPAPRRARADRWRCGAKPRLAAGRHRRAALPAGRAARRPPVDAAEMFGITPEPTALASLGLLLASSQPPSSTLRCLLAIIPTLSLLVGAATL